MKIDVPILSGDLKLVTFLKCWCKNFDLGDIFWMLTLMLKIVDDGN